MPRRQEVEDIPELFELALDRRKKVPKGSRCVSVSQHFDSLSGWTSRVRAQTKGQRRCMEAWVEKWGEFDPTLVEFTTTFLDQWLVVEMVVYPNGY